MSLRLETLRDPSKEAAASTPPGISPASESRARRGRAAEVLWACSSSSMPSSCDVTAPATQPELREVDRARRRAGLARGLAGQRAGERECRLAGEGGREGVARQRLRRVLVVGVVGEVGRAVLDRVERRLRGREDRPAADLLALRLLQLRGERGRRPSACVNPTGAGLPCDLQDRDVELRPDRALELRDVHAARSASDFWSDAISFVCAGNLSSTACGVLQLRSARVGGDRDEGDRVARDEAGGAAAAATAARSAAAACATTATMPAGPRARQTAASADASSNSTPRSVVCPSASWRARASGMPSSTAQTPSVIGSSMPSRRPRSRRTGRGRQPFDHLADLRSRLVGVAPRAISSPARRLRPGGCQHVTIRSPMPGEPGERLGLSPARLAQPRHLDQAARDQRRLRVVAEREAVDGARPRAPSRSSPRRTARRRSGRC